MLVPTSVDRGCHEVSATDPHVHILGFLDRSRYYFFQLALPLFQAQYLSQNLVAPGIEPGNCDSVARNSAHLTTEAVDKIEHTRLKRVKSMKNLPYHIELY
jgi:hypothetical protein